MLFKEVNSFYTETHMKHINAKLTVNCMLKQVGYVIIIRL
jgi:hypothetical protein